MPNLAGPPTLRSMNANPQTEVSPDAGASPFSDSEIIDALGGTMAVAKICEVRGPSVSEWRYNGIPRARRQYLRLLYPRLFQAVPAVGLSDEARIVHGQRLAMQDAIDREARASALSDAQGNVDG